MRWLLLIFLFLAPCAALANEEDKGRLARLLESSLSGAGRDVSIEGFQGALSSHATIERLTISDVDGVWLTLSGIELIWTRTALLRGRVEVEKLIASEILLDRLPKTDPSTPSPESGEFALPELPVSINIGELNAGHVELGEAVMGQALSFTLLGKVSLADGSGAAMLNILRTDGPQGHVNLMGAFDNVERNLEIDLKLTEAENGVVVDLLNIPGSPPLHLSLQGNDPVDAFVANLSLATDGHERLAGVIASKLQEEINDQGQVSGQARVFGVDLAGDMAPLFAPEYRDFFGTNASLTSVVRQSSDGRTHLDQLLVNARSFNASGEMVLAAKGMPERMALDVTLVDPDGSPVLLPSQTGISLENGRVELRYDQSDSDSWSLRGRLQELILPDTTMASLTLDGSGRIRHGDRPRVAAGISLKAIGISPTDPDNLDVANALGDVASVATRFHWESGSPLIFETLELKTEQSQIRGSGQVKGPFEDLTVSGQADANVRDLAFLEPIINRPIRGAVEARLSGSAQPLTGAFDITLTTSTSQLRVGEESIDALIGEESTLAISMIRDSQGVVLRSFQVKSDALAANAKGDLRTGSGSLVFDAALDDVNRLAPQFRGPVTISGNGQETEEGWTARIESTAPGDTTAVGQLSLPKGRGGKVDLNIVIGNIQALVPSLKGSANIDLSALRQDDGWEIDGSGQGSNIFELATKGFVDNGFQSGDLDVSGHFPLELINTLTDAVSLQGSSAFDLKLNGPFALSNVNGTLSTRSARLSMPELKFALSDLNLDANIAGAAASINASGAARTGGGFDLNGSVALQAPFSGDLQLALNNMVLRYEDLLETELLGDVRVSGPLTGGATISGLIDLVHTEINVAGASLGADQIPEIRHVGEPAYVFRTRDFAGLINKGDSGAGSSASPFVLDLLIQANNRIFVRGLGLDAEFEGEVGLNGPTDAIMTSGEFGLTRGRIDFLTKRLDLTEGLVRLEGDFVPFMKMVAETSTTDASFEIILEGRATDPDFSINSTPDMPDEEALSLILFGQSIDNISAIQAAQLASAVASLRGQGGGGGLLGGLRKGIGLDNLDITTDDQGTAGISAGKHISERVYTEIGVDGKGESSISLNLDISPKFTVKGRLESDSDTGIGLFYKLDY